MLLVAGLLLSACAPASDREAAKSAQDSIVTIDERFLTARDTIDNLDSPAAWRAPDGRIWVIATAKETDELLVYDGGNGQLIRRVGGTGKGGGQLDRPNGIAVHDARVFVVERDNHRVQVFSLPDFRSLGVFGGETFVLPYGIALGAAQNDSLDVYVTDQPDLTGTTADSLRILSNRVRRYRVALTGAQVGARLVASFGDTQGAGRLTRVETLFADPAHDRLLIADEAERVIKIYSLDGRYQGQNIQGYFATEPEGVALFQCGQAGFWIATDQHDTNNTFHVFDRTSLRHLGAFSGRTTRNTDGVALLQASTSQLPGGAFYAVHDDGSIGAFAWADIASALRLECRG
jgi:3-phytase